MDFYDAVKLSAYLYKKSHLSFSRASSALCFCHNQISLHFESWRLFICLLMQFVEVHRKLCWKGFTCRSAAEGFR